jgi:SAM-dependent methyltransferase
MMFGFRDEFTYVVCDRCGSLNLLDAPRDIGHYYPSGYYSLAVDPVSSIGRPGVRAFARLVANSALHHEGKLARAAARGIPHRQFRTLVSMLSSIGRSGVDMRNAKILDVGTGSGVIPFVAKMAGVPEVLGIDPYMDADHLVGGAQLRRGVIADVDGEWDLVMFHHSLEHLDDPRHALQHARRLLADGGVVLVRVPTVSSEAWDRYGADWASIDAPRHFFLPTRDGVAALASSAGLRVLRVVDDSNDFQFWCSEQYRRNIPMMAPESYFVDPKASAFNRAEMRRFRREARVLNAQHRGDQAAFYMVSA